MRLFLVLLTALLTLATALRTGPSHAAVDTKPATLGGFKMF